jgi:GPH family glycoside/pentoside/hexuronide:cation symporter
LTTIPAEKQIDVAGSDFVLPRTVLFGWGLGTIAPVAVLTATNVLLLRYMTDFVGIGAGLAASLIAFSKFFDAFADPTMGALSDRISSKVGRRRPFLLWGGVALALTVVALFSAPAALSLQGRIIYMGVMLLAYALAYTIFNVPYLAMPAEMTKSYHERSHLMSYRVYAVGGAQMLTSYLGPMLIARTGGAKGHMIMALALAPVIVASALACYLMTAKAAFTERPEKARYPLGVQIRSVVANAPFFILILTKFLTLMTLGVQAVFPFFFKRVLGVSDAYLGTYFLLSSILLIISQPVWLWLGRRLGKRVTYMLALGVAVPVSLSWLLAGHGESILLVYLRGILTGFGSGGAILMGQSMLPDTMDYDYRRTGLRREGIFAGFYTTVEKLAGAVGIAIVGAFLSASGYIQSTGATVAQPPSAIKAIYIAISCLPALISGLGVVALIFYDLSEHKLHATGRLKSHPV